MSCGTGSVPSKSWATPSEATGDFWTAAAELRASLDSCTTGFGRSSLSTSSRHLRGMTRPASSSTPRTTLCLSTGRSGCAIGSKSSSSVCLHSVRPCLTTLQSPRKRHENPPSVALGSAYDDWHREHSGGRDPNKLAFFNWVLDLAAPAQGAELLDVACGDGSFLSVAIGRRISASGADLSPVAIDIARTSVPGGTFSVADAEALPYDESSFDVVTCLGSLEHFPRPDKGAAEIARVLRPDGTAVIFVPNLFFLGHIWFGLRHGTQPSEGEQQFSETFKTSAGWIELLESSNLSIGRWEVWNKIHASAKVSSMTMRLWNIVSHATPRNGAYAFAFVCTKGNP